nr:carboxypeptidase-like regulatory domain-containing protein [Anaerolinea sp.]
MNPAPLQSPIGRLHLPFGRPRCFTSGAGGRIDVVLGNQPAAAAGTVSKASTEALPGVVVLVPEDRMTGSPEVPPGTQQRWEAAVDQNGAFRIENVPPGEYRVYAF